MADEPPSDSQPVGEYTGRAAERFLADHPPHIGEPEWLVAIEDESDRAAVRAVFARKRWREQFEDHPAWDVP